MNGSWKRLVDNNGRDYYLDREKIVGIYRRGGQTVFLFEGQLITIEISFENAFTWLTTAA